MLLSPTKRWPVAWIQSFLALVCGQRGVTDLACPTLGKESVGTQQRWGKHEKKGKRTYSGRNEGGSSANRVRKLLVKLDSLKEATHSFCSVTIVFFFQENKSFDAQLFALILCQYVANITCGTASTSRTSQPTRPCEHRGPWRMVENRHKTYVEKYQARASIHVLWATKKNAPAWGKCVLLISPYLWNY
jgi:hypothetical protein